MNRLILLTHELLFDQFELLLQMKRRIKKGRRKATFSMCLINALETNIFKKVQNYFNKKEIAVALCATFFYGLLFQDLSNSIVANVNKF